MGGFWAQCCDNNHLVSHLVQGKAKVFIVITDILDDRWNGSGSDVSLHISTERQTSQLTDNSGRRGLAGPLWSAVF